MTVVVDELDRKRIEREMRLFNVDDIEDIVNDIVTKDLIRAHVRSHLYWAAIWGAAAEIPRRLGGEATGPELAEDKRVSRRLANAHAVAAREWAKVIGEDLVNIELTDDELKAAEERGVVADINRHLLIVESSKLMVTAMKERALMAHALRGEES